MKRSSDRVGLISRRGFVWSAGGLLFLCVAGVLGRIFGMRWSRWGDYPGYEWPPAVTLEDPYYRAPILDTHGEVLAETVSFLGLIASRFDILNMEKADLDPILDELARILDRPRKHIVTLLGRKRPVVWIERVLSPAQLARLDTYLARGGRLHGFSKQRAFSRLYGLFPAGSCVIGYMFQKLIPDKESLGHCHHEADKFQKGLEKVFNDRLEGITGALEAPRDKNQRILVHRATKAKPAVPGEPIQVALDIKLQRKVEQIAEAHRKYWSAEVALVTVARIDNGDLLCAARMPQGPPDQPCWKWEESLSNCENFIGSFYLGSVIKPLVYAGGIQFGAVRPDEIIDVPHSITIGGKTFTNRRKFPDRMSVTDCLVSSVKTAAIIIGQRLERRIDREGIFQMLRDFGIGEIMGLPFFRESGGRLPDHLKRSSLYIAEASIGYEVELNHLTLIRAYSCLLGKDRSVLPRLVVAQGPHVGAMDPLPVRPASGPISGEAGEAVLRMLEEAVSRGTGRGAGIKNVSLSGKTGTARAYRAKPYTPEGAPPPVGPFGFLKDRAHCSFTGFVGRSHLIAVTFLFTPAPCPECRDADKRGKMKRRGSCDHVYASNVACPAFRDIAQLLVRPDPGGGKNDPGELDGAPVNLA